MTREEALGLIAEDMESISGVEPADVNEDAKLAELGVDSLSMIELVVVTEERFGIRIPAGTEFDIQTVGQLVDRAVAE